MKIGEFFYSLLAPDGEISSKRFFGGLLILFFIAGGITGVINDSVSEVVESILKTGLYTGAGLLGANVVETTMKLANRTPKPVVEPKEDENKS